MLVIIADDMAFLSNSNSLLALFKKMIGEEFDFKLFGRLSFFLSW